MAAASLSLFRASRSELKFDMSAIPVTRSARETSRPEAGRERRSPARVHSVPFDGRVGVLDGVFVIEINHNPNLDVGAEDNVLGDEVCRRLLGPLRAKFEARNGAPAPQAGLTSEAMTLPDTTRGSPGSFALHDALAGTSHCQSLCARPSIPDDILMRPGLQ